MCIQIQYLIIRLKLHIYILSYIKGTDSLGLFKYNWNSTTNKYDLDQDYARELFGSSNINFID